MINKNNKFISEEDDELEVDEGTTTASAGGEYSTKYAFGNKKKPAPKGFTYVEPSLYENYDDLLKNMKRLINEISYNEFKKDNSSSYKQKINKGISEISAKLHEMEQTLRRVHKLKTEINADQSIFFKSTFTRFSKISEKLLKLSNQIRELSK